MSTEGFRLLDFLRPRVSPKRDLALQEARKIAVRLHETYGSDVWGVGSLFAEGEIFTEGSDIDLVASGIPDREYFAALARSAEMTEFHLDLIPLEDANDLIQRTILDPRRSRKLA